jgi:hypothetical protein
MYKLKEGGWDYNQRTKIYWHIILIGCMIMVRIYIQRKGADHGKGKAN